MTTRTITAVVMALGLVAASAGGARAGSGGEGRGLPEPGGDIFTCYFINSGAKSGVILKDLNDQFTNPTDVVVGVAQLLCTPAVVTDAIGNFTPTVFGTRNPDHILCYEVKQPSNAASNIVATIEDPLSPGATQTVRVASTKYVCVQAIKTCDSGCPPDTTPPTP